MTHSTCPFCNSAVPSPTPLYCPRCEERLPGGEVTTVTQNSTKNQSPNWFQIGFPISCMLSIVILVFGLYFVNKDKNPPPNTQVTKPNSADVGPATIPPLGLPALGYLPASVQIVAAIQMPPLEPFSARLNSNPRDILASTGIPASFFDSLNKAGIPFESIHHVALGLTLLPDNVIPNVYLVVAFKTAPANSKDLVKKWEKEKLLNVLPVSAELVNNRYLLIGNDLKSFSKTLQPPGAAHLNASLRETLEKQVSPAAFGWLATQTQVWNDLPSVKAMSLAMGSNEISKVIPSGRAIAISFSLEPEFTAGIAVKCDSEETAKALQNHFGVKGAGKPWIVGGIEGWATLDAAVPPQEIGKLFSQLLPAKK